MDWNIAPQPCVAYFSMEIAIEEHIHTYSGGRGVLAGDTLRAAADLGFPIVGLTLMHRLGYFRQELDAAGHQTEHSSPWEPQRYCDESDARAWVDIEGRRVAIRVWQYVIKGISGHAVPVYLLDTNVPGNSEWDQTLTALLYGGDQRYRLCQETTLGIGGVRIFEALGHHSIRTYHMNEAHASLLALALLERQIGSCDLGTASEADIDQVRKQCVFTTHTPVPAGHDQFPRELMRSVLGADRARVLEVTHCCPAEALNITFLALRFFHYVNGVAMYHGEVSRGLFPRYPIRAITMAYMLRRGSRRRSRRCSIGTFPNGGETTSI